MENIEDEAKMVKGEPGPVPGSPRRQKRIKPGGG